MLLDDLTLHSSKYLWGIRRASNPTDVPAIEGAVMISPLGGDQPPTTLGSAHAYLLNRIKNCL